MFCFDNDDDDVDDNSPRSVGCLFWYFLQVNTRAERFESNARNNMFCHCFALLWLGDWLKKKKNTRAIFIVDAKPKPIVIYS